jgi:carbamoyltransferase
VIITPKPVWVNFSWGASDSQKTAEIAPIFITAKIKFYSVHYDDSMNIVGLSAYYHDSACCLLQNGRLIAAAQEERFSRQKHDSSLPKAAFAYCLKEAGIDITDIDCIGYYESPKVKLERQIWTEFPEIEYGRAVTLWRSARRLEYELQEVLGYSGPIHYVGHHEAHAASSFFYSGLQEAAILTVDGVGEWTTTTYGRGCGSAISIFEEVLFPDSLGLLYSMVTSYLGFAVNDGEYKVMGLAPYGRPMYVEHFRSLLKTHADGQYRLGLQYFDFKSDQCMYSNQLVELLGRPPRKASAEIDPFHKDVARSLQSVLEELLIEKVRYLHDRTGAESLCMAGGVALNCVANSRILRDGPFRRVFVQPAAGDAGTSLGAAALAHTHKTGQRIADEALGHVFLGPSFSADEIYGLLGSTGLEVQDFREREEALLEATVERLAAGKVVGWFGGRMEFGPRALGARSILADPRRPEMRDRINALVKKRESFRPFAPAVLSDKREDHFALDHPSPFMLETCQVVSKIELPAITHVDGSARVQTVDEATNRRFYHLLKLFECHTGCPILLNTSFNMRDEPIVCSPVDALLSFVRSEIDVLVLEDFLIDRSIMLAAWEHLFGDPLPESKRGITHKVYTLI